jgi:hypothetical protein
MSNIAMNNQTDLDWLARNVHEWPAGDHQPWCYVYQKDGVKKVSGNCITVIQPCVKIDRGDWLARRAELQNKPSWADALEWAEWLAQDTAGLDGIGAWWWYRVKPTKGDRTWSSKGHSSRPVPTRGEVIGDWRDTLEKRPADLSEPAVTERLNEATQTVLAAAPALMDDKYLFEYNTKPVSVTNETVQLERPIAVAGTGNGSAAESAFLIGRVIDLLRTSVDHFSADELADLNELTGAELTKRDERVCGGQKYIDAHWYERGGLPPFGLEVEWKPWSDAPWVKAVIMADAGDGEYVIRVDGVKKIVGSPANFRPIRTERDVLIEIIKKTDDTDDKIADAILAAGFSLRDK